MNFLQKLISVFQSKSKIEHDMKKFLIVGLGNIGENIEDTRHNIGFKILDSLAEKEDISF